MTRSNEPTCPVAHGVKEVSATPVAAGRYPRVSGVNLVNAGRRVRRDALGLVQRVADECGDIGGFRVGPVPVVLVNSPELLGRVLGAEAENYPKGRIQLRALRPLMGTGLLTSEGELHRRQRRFAAPAFTPRNVVRHLDTVAAMTGAWVDSLRDGQEIELLDELFRFKLNLVGQMLVSRRLGDGASLAEAVHGALDFEVRAITRLFPLPLAVPTPANRRSRRSIDHLHTAIDELVTTRRAESTQPDDMLAALLAARDADGAGMSARQLRDEILTLALTATETPANAFTWTLYHILSHPEVAERLYAEVREVLGDGPVTAENVGELRYTAQVYKESLRLTPVAPIIMRTAAQEATLGGYRVPKGAIVLASPYTLHRRPDLYPDPERFDPDRFEPDRERAMPKYSFLPFGVGPRVCIGNHLSMLEGPAILATIAQRVRLELLPGQRIEQQYLINIRPRNGIRVAVRRRESVMATSRSDTEHEKERTSA